MLETEKPAEIRMGGMRNEKPVQTREAQIIWGDDGDPSTADGKSHILR